LTSSIIPSPAASSRIFSHFFDVGLELGEEVMPQAMAMLEGKPMVYGKAAFVDVSGKPRACRRDLASEAWTRPMLGAPTRSSS
jgi:hypothetical protein